MAGQLGQPTKYEPSLLRVIGSNYGLVGRLIRDKFKHRISECMNAKAENQSQV